MKKWVLPFLSLVFSVSLMVPLVLGVNGPLTQNLQYKFYTGQNALFTALLNGDIDFMAWPLTYAQYQWAKITSNITVAPYFDMGYYEIAFNNNYTDPSHTADRKAMNCTEFRQAMACLVDKDGLIAGSSINSFGTRIDTPVSRPFQNAWVNFNDSKYAADGSLLNNYPWDYNTTKALEILWTNNWYSHTTYPTLTDLLTAYGGVYSWLPAGSVVYPSGHPRAGTPIDSIVAYIRSDHPPRKEAGDKLALEMRSIGISVTQNDLPSSGCYPPVFINHDYDFYTSAWSFGRFPTHFWRVFSSFFDTYGLGSNIYMVDDWNLTRHATLECPSATSSAQSMAEALICQDIIVQQAMCVSLYSAASYIAYRTGVVGAINFRGYGLESNLEYTFMNAMVPPYGSSMTLRYGTLNPPEQINPIFSSWVWDYEVTDSIFNSPMATNPYNPSFPGKSPAGADLPWMAYDWNWQLSNFTGGGGLGDPSDSYTNMANVTFWFRHDITWQDGAPFTVDDFNYTIYINKAYGDSWGWSDADCIVNFVKWDNWTCSLYFLYWPTYYTLYMANYDIVPEHIYKYIAIPANADAGTSTTGHHGYWPSAAAVSGEVLPGAPFTFTQLTGTGGEQYTWVGTGMWKYVPSTLIQGDGGGLSLVPYTGFWMNITQGEIDFEYAWNAGSAPQGGSYSIGLSDLVLLANAYGTSGNGHAVPFLLGGLHVWEPGCDIAPPAGTVGLSDLVTLALHYGQHWGANP
jgi:ABC-type transport system substrate-binding protein